MFSCRFSTNVPQLLLQLRCSIVISTYQAGKVIFLSPDATGQRLVQLPRTVQKPMGIAIRYNGNQIAIAEQDAVSIHTNAPLLASSYPNQPQTYDALFMPRTTLHTGALDLHDLAWGDDGRLYAVNTLFSCIVCLDDLYSFTPIWQPPFINELASDDRCHLNGMALHKGKPRFVTAFGASNTPQGWRANVPKGGLLMDIQHNEIWLNDLSMPHSPRIFNDQLYILLSATGELVHIDLPTRQASTITNLGGFVRGLAQHNDFLFIGLSKLRASSTTFSKLTLPRSQAGIVIFHLPTQQVVGEIVYEDGVEEIYDVQILPNYIRPNLLTTAKPESLQGLSIPKTGFWAAEKSLS